MKVGAKIPKVENGTLGTEPIDFDLGLQRYRTVMQRLQREAPTTKHVLFGYLTHEEWINMHLRHSELHLSFLKPRGN